MSANGTTVGVDRPPVGAFNFAEWRAVTERALRLVGERRQHARSEAQRWLREAERLEREADVLLRALQLELAPPSTEPAALPGPEALPLALAPLVPAGLPPLPEIVKGQRADGQGAGARSGAYLLELARIRAHVHAEQRCLGSGHRPRIDIAQDGVDALTGEVCRLACKGWSATTISRGLERLVSDGYLVRTRQGHFTLTAAGLNAGPAPFALPLRDPDAEDAGQGGEAQTAPRPRTLVSLVRTGESE